MGLRKFSIEEAHHEHPHTAEHDAQWQRTEGSIRVKAGATACSLRVFHGLLTWANLNAQIASKPEITTLTGQHGVAPNS